MAPLLWRLCCGAVVVALLSQRCCCGAVVVAPTSRASDVASRADFQSGWTRTSLSGAVGAIGSEVTGSGDIAPMSGAPGGGAPLAHLREREILRSYTAELSTRIASAHLGEHLGEYLGAPELDQIG